MSNGSTDFTLIQNPYVGPRTFQKRHRNLYFGREREARDLLSLVIAEPLVLFTAQSGAGKSSLINTRLIPGLQQNKFEVLPVGRVGSGAPPGTAAQAGNIYIFNLLLSLDENRRPANELANLTLDSYLHNEKQRLSGESQNDDGSDRPKHTGRVLIIDQFEEIVTTNHTYWDAREGFFRQLNAAIRHDPFLWVVLTMREDYVASLDPYLHLMHDQLRTRFYMQRMGTAAAREAIEKPAANRNRPFAPGVSTILIDNLRQLRVQGTNTDKLGQFVEPVQLQVVCHQLWNKLHRIPGDTITLQNMEQALGSLEEAVDSSLGQFYQQAIELIIGATTVNELALRNWFEHVLITPSRTRGTVYRGQNTTAGLPNEALRILDTQFLLRTERRAGAVWYELIHDRFIEPILHSNHAWRLRQKPVLLAADKWERAGRPRHLLYEGNQLEQAIAESKQDVPNPLVNSFLKASEDAQVDKRLDAAEQEAKEKMARAADEAAAARRERRRSYAIGALFAVGIIMTVIAVYAYFQADQNLAQAMLAEQEAQTGRVQAQEASILAIDNENQAVTAQAQAIEQRNTAEAASTETARQEEVAKTARADTIFQRETAEAASTETVQQRQTAEAAEADAQRQKQTADDSLDAVQAQQNTLLAQYLAFQALNITRQNNDTELAMLLLTEAAAINQTETATSTEQIETAEQVQALIQRTLLPLYEQTYFNTTLKGHEGEIKAIAFSAETNQLVTAGVDGTIRLWSLDSPGGPEQIITGNEGGGDFIDISANGQTVAAASLDGTIHLWQNGQPAATFFADQSTIAANPRFEAIRDIELSPNGDILAVSIQNRIDTDTITLWTNLDADSPRPNTPQSYNIEGFEHLIFNADGTRLFAYAYSEIIPRVFEWNTSNFSQLAEIRQGNLPRAFSAGGATIYYDTNSLREGFAGRMTIPGRTATFYNSIIPDGFLAALSPDGSLLATVTNATIYVWRPDGNTLSLATTLTGHTSPITDITIHPDGETIASAAADGTIRLWRPNRAAEATDHPATFLTISGDQLVSIHDNIIEIGNANNRLTDLAPLLGLTNDARAVALSPDSRFLIIGGGTTNNGTLTVWDFANPAAPPAFYANAQASRITALAFSPDSQRFASGGGVSTSNSDVDVINVWDPTNLEQPLITLEDPVAQVIGLAFVPNTNNQELVSINRRNRVILWDLSTGTSTNWPDVLPQTPAVLTISPDGRWLAVGTDDTEGTLYVWDLQNRDLPPLQFRGHLGSIDSITFTADSNTVVTGGEDGTIRLWQPALPSAAATILRGHTQPINTLAYTADGILLSSDNTQTLIWSSLNQFLDTGCKLIQRNLTAAEWQLYIGDLEDYQPTCQDYPEHYTVTQ